MKYKVICLKIEIGSNTKYHGGKGMEEKYNLGTKRGYLKGNYHITYIKDQKQTEYELHYHDFHKIVIMLSGKVIYHIEGKEYELRPYDILFIGSKQIHLPIIDTSEPYERVVLWIDPIYLSGIERETRGELATGFIITNKYNINLVRLDGIEEQIDEWLVKIKDDNASSSGKKVSEGLVLDFISYLNKLIIVFNSGLSKKYIQQDDIIQSAIRYISSYILEDFTVDDISKKLNVNKASLMLSFKKATGFTIKNYIIQKRLILADTLIMSGKTIEEAYEISKFKNYSSFVRIFRDAYGLSPRRYYKNMLIEKQN